MQNYDKMKNVEKFAHFCKDPFGDTPRALRTNFAFCRITELFL
ncbi:hypothetical protein [uncultured Bacteroides sp.]|nr:hypothetical protein [uncultured Bacteroides sp.]